MDDRLGFLLGVAGAIILFLGMFLGMAIERADWRTYVAPLCEAHGKLVSPAQTVYLFPDACVEALTNG